MCKIISSDLVIGNIIYESVKKDHYEIPMSTISSFDDQLSEAIKEYNCFTNFTLDNIRDFQMNYPFIATISNNALSINKNEEKTCLIETLRNYFRAGIPTSVVNAIQKTFQEVTR